LRRTSDTHNMDGQIRFGIGVALALAALFGVTPASANQVSATVAVAARYGVVVPARVGELQKDALDQEFFQLFKKVRDLTSSRIGTYVEARPKEFLAVTAYLGQLQRDFYISVDTARQLQGAATRGLQRRLERRQRRVDYRQTLSTEGPSRDDLSPYLMVPEDEQQKTTQTDTAELDYAVKIFQAALEGKDIEAMAASDVERSAGNLAEQVVESSMQRTFRNASVEISGFSEGNPDFEIGYVASIWEKDDDVAFQQTTINSRDGRTTLNAGMGYRILSDTQNWMTELSAFYDHEFPNDHQRYGVGMALHSRPINLAANYYEAISDYKTDRDGGEAMPLDGYDAKLSIALPYLPGVLATYETSEWYGLDGTDDLTRNTTGIKGQLSKNFSLTYEQAEYSDDRDDTERLSLTYNWRPDGDEPPTLFDVTDEPWEFDSVAYKKYSFVERENKIVKQTRNATFGVVVKGV